MKKLSILVMIAMLIGCMFGCSEKEITVKFIALDEVVYEVTDSHKMQLDVPEYQLDGYNFYGWFLEDGSEADFSKEIEESVTFYAKLVKVYTVKWVNEDQELLVQEYEENTPLEVIEMEIPQSSQPHQAFIFWSDDLGNQLQENTLVTKDTVYSATYEYTAERIDLEYDPLVFESASGWKRAGISDNLYGVESLKITCSDESVAYYSDTHIIAVSSGECQFRIESPDGRLIKYMTVIVK